MMIHHSWPLASNGESPSAFLSDDEDDKDEDDDNDTRISGGFMEEHDYMGLTDKSPNKSQSGPVTKKSMLQKRATGANLLGEKDLQLGLGPPKQESFSVMIATMTKTKTDDLPHKSSCVVGWPPVGPFRKALPNPKICAHENINKDSSVDKKDSRASLFVKVNMDGVPVGRKVDLKAFNTYHALSQALKEMFQLTISGLGSSHITSYMGTSGFVAGFNLTYEDKDGDWMLVGDVPWGMFINTVHRLRIMKCPESSISAN